MTIIDRIDHRFLAMLPKTFFPGSLFMGRSAAGFLGTLKGLRILVLISPSARRQYEEDLRRQLGDCSFMEHSGEPTVQDMEALAARIDGHDVLIGVGGGSVLDLAKTVRLKHDIGLILIPTTVGTGSESSQFSLLLEGTQKRVFSSHRMLPDAVLLSSAYVATSEDIIAYSGIDALSHALEGLVSKAGNPLTDALAVAAIDLLFTHLAGAAQKDPASLETVQTAGFLAGLVQSTASVGLAHALAHQLGPVNGVRHAKAIAGWLPVAIAFNMGRSEAYGKLDRCSATSRSGILDDLGRLYEQLGIGAEAIRSSMRSGAVADAIRKDVCMRTNPVMPTAEEIGHLLEDA